MHYPSLPNKTISLVPGGQDGNSEGQGNSSGDSSRTGAIAGGVVGGVVLLTIAAIGVWFLRRSRRSPHSFGRGPIVDMDEEPRVTPYGFPSSETTTSAPNLYSSGGNHVYNPQSAVGGDEYSQTTGAAATVGFAASAPRNPSQLTKAQQAGLAPRASGDLHTHGTGTTSPDDGRASSNEMSAAPRPPGSARRDSLMSSAAGTALTSSTSPTEAVAGLRQEVQDLRHVMLQLQTERLEAPPQYEV